MIIPNYKQRTTVLLERIKVLEGEVAKWKEDFGASQIDGLTAVAQRDQARTALKLALGALETGKAYFQDELGEQFTDAFFELDPAIEAIKACGVTL